MLFPVDGWHNSTEYWQQTSLLFKLELIKQSLVITQAQNEKEVVTVLVQS